jgi:ubiquinone/menaquinone biosynthesis C-methylase UbiE
VVQHWERKTVQKPAHLGPEYGAQFSDASVVSAYRFRPPYPAETFKILNGLRAPGPRVVLDAGCGSGDLAVPLLEFAERVDAVDPSAAMLTAGQARPGGDDARLHWIAGTMEDAPLDGPYALITTGESLHWMDWPVVMRRFRELLAPEGRLAIVNRSEQPNPWAADLQQLINQYSTNRDYQPYDLVHELTQRGLLHVVASEHTEFRPFTQSIDAYIESIHSRNGFSRDRMTIEAAAAFDRAVRTLLQPFAIEGTVTLQVGGSVVSGLPTG